MQQLCMFRRRSEWVAVSVLLCADGVGRKIVKLCDRCLHLLWAWTCLITGASRLSVWCVLSRAGNGLTVR